MASQYGAYVWYLCLDAAMPFVSVSFPPLEEKGVDWVEYAMFRRQGQPPWNPFYPWVDIFWYPFAPAMLPIFPKSKLALRCVRHPSHTPPQGAADLRCHTF